MSASTAWKSPFKRLAPLSFFILVACLAPAQNQPAPLPHAPNRLLSQLFPSPDWKDGYQFYVKAADILRDGFQDIFTNWSDRQLAFEQFSQQEAAKSPGFDKERADERIKLVKSLSGTSLLSVRKAMVSRYGEALGWIHKGNQLPVNQPASSIALYPAYPEVASFRNLARLMQASAYISFSQGDTKAGVAQLMDMLAFAHNLQYCSDIHFFVGVAIETIAFEEFTAHLPQLSQSQCRDLQTSIDHLLAMKPPLLGVVHHGREIARGVVLSLALGSASGLELEIKALPDTGRSEFKSELIKMIDRRYDLFEEALKHPETEWYDRSIDKKTGRLAANKLQSLEDAAFDELAPPALIALIQMRIRAQLRLLRLHAKLLTYKWDTGQMPASIEKFATKEDLADPLSGTQFRYQLFTNKTYRLYSPGTPITGEVELIYQPPAANGAPPTTG
jgi:hypothetical protein